MNLRQAYELQTLAGKFFSMDVLLLGNNIWVRSYLPTTAFLFITDYFVTDVAQSLLRIISIPVQFFLIQKASEHVARKRFDLEVLGSCWWSVWWRATLYTVAVGLVAVIAIAVIIYPLINDLDIDSMSAEELAEEISARDPLNMGVDSAIILFILYVIGSFLAVGYAALRAFRISCKKTHQCPGFVRMEEVLEEEERENRAEQDDVAASAVAAEPASEDISRYEPPPGYSIRPKPAHTSSAKPLMPQPPAAEKTEPEDLSRYMPPSEKVPEPPNKTGSKPAQPTDLVGAAPGFTKSPDLQDQDKEKNQTRQRDHRGKDEG